MAASGRRITAQCGPTSLKAAAQWPVTQGTISGYTDAALQVVTLQSQVAYRLSRTGDGGGQLLALRVRGVTLRVISAQFPGRIPLYSQWVLSYDGGPRWGPPYSVEGHWPTFMNTVIRNWIRAGVNNE